MPTIRPIQKRDWRFIAIVAIGALAIFLFVEHFAFPHMRGWFSDKNTVEIVAIATLFLTILGVTWQIIFYKLTHYPILNLGLDFKQVYSLTSMITARVKNSGGGKLFPRTAHLLIDEGVQSGNTYSFPNLMKYPHGKKHCQLAYACHSETSAYPENLVEEDHFKGTFHAFFPLKYLSESLTRIGKSEWFSETVVLNLPKPGVYRAIFVFSTSDDRCRCRCTTVVFPEDGLKPQSSSINQ